MKKSLLSLVTVLALSVIEVSQAAVGSGFRGAGAGAITENNLSLSDIATANATTSRHGLAPKLSGSTNQTLHGDGSYSAIGMVPAIPARADRYLSGLNTWLSFDSLWRDPADFPYSAITAGTLLYHNGTKWLPLALGANGTALLAGDDPGVFGADNSLIWSAISEAYLNLSDNLTNNVSIARHGLVPKLPNDATLYFDGTGNFTAPSGTAIGSTSGGSSGIGGMAILTTSGSWVAPVGVTRVRVRAWGAGGGGRSTATAASGGGGSYSEGVFTVVPSTSYSYTIGAAGAAGGGNGGNTTFHSFVTAGGGVGGTGGSAGGTATGGTYNVSGQSGSTGGSVNGGAAPLGGFGGTVSSVNGKLPGGGGYSANAATGGAGLIMLEFSAALNANGGLQGTYTAVSSVDFGNTAPGLFDEVSVTVTGAAIGDSVTLGVPYALLQNSFYDAFVYAADTVKIRMHNIGGSSYDPASQSIRVTVFHY